jgi:hypothetical protein
MRLRVGLLVVVVGLVFVAAVGAATPTWPAWLCRPGLRINYCNTYLSVTVFTSSTKSVVKISDTTSPPVDCFYVYPTASQEHRGNADLKINQPIEAPVIAQAARFSQACRVFAPVYRQTTGYPGGNSNLAYDDVLAAWRDYLAHYNHGRGVVLIGHSQGSFMLERLLSDPTAGVRKHLVSALLLGGDVEVNAANRFDGLPACTSTSQIGCVVGYSSWGRTPPAYADLEQVANASQHVLCVNPGSLSAGSAPITPIFAWAVPEGLVPGAINPTPTTFWISFPDLYTARCVRQGHRSWLLITRIHHRNDPRPTVHPILDPTEGLHAADINIALGNLIALVQSQAKAWKATH